MTARQVAEVYGVAVGEIERIPPAASLRSPKRCHSSSKPRAMGRRHESPAPHWLHALLHTLAFWLMRRDRPAMVGGLIFGLGSVVGRSEGFGLSALTPDESRGAPVS